MNLQQQEQFYQMMTRLKKIQERHQQRVQEGRKW